MQYMSVKEASSQWEMDVSTIGKMLRAGRITGAKKIGNNWVIPIDTPRPADRRTQTAKAEQRADFYRFPFFADFKEKSFIPPLSKEEALLRQAQVDFFACRFDRARKTFNYLSENAESIYVKISATAFHGIVSAYSYDGTDPYIDFLSMNALLENNFPRKKEMELFLPLFYDFFSMNEEASKNLKIDPEYKYDPFCWSLISFLSFSYSAVRYLNYDERINTAVYEIICQQAGQEGYLYETQVMHILLYIAYYLENDEKNKMYHLRKGLEIAKANNMLLTPAIHSHYYPEDFHRVLDDYPKEFAEKVFRYGNLIHESVVRFSNANNVNDIYYNAELNPKDYQYILYALKGYTNKEVAEIINVSERTVAKRYCEIYEKLGIPGKTSLMGHMDSSIIQPEAHRKTEEQEIK